MFRCRYQNLSILVEQCEAHIRNHGYFEADGVQISGSRQTGAETPRQEPLRRQSGCFRTNCKDALDRTNVVQSVFAERFLVSRLRSLGLLGAGEGIGSSAQLSAAFMNTWADNADALAMAYVGTPALKTDFTRTGKRTIRGAAMDGWHSCHRYFLGERYSRAWLLDG
jgi:phosphatidylinositol 4-phosphatase